MNLCFHIKRKSRPMDVTARGRPAAGRTGLWLLLALSTAFGAHNPAMRCISRSPLAFSKRKSMGGGRIGLSRTSKDKEAGKDDEKRFSEYVEGKYQTFITSTAGYFASLKPPEPQEAHGMLRIAQLATVHLGPNNRLLDVGTGTGDMVPFYLQGDGFNASQVVGIDISPGMIERAREKFPSAVFVCGDVDTMLLEGLGGKRFESIVINACISHFWDPVATIARLADQFLQTEGKLIISHPRGREFIDRMRGKDNSLFRHGLPNREDIQLLVQGPWSKLKPISFNDEADYFCAVFQKAE